VRLDGAARERLAILARGLEMAQTHVEAAVGLVELLGLLRAEGAPFVPVFSGDLIEVPSAPVLRLSHALDIVLSRLEDGPSMTDLDAALGLSSRQINRVVTDFNRRYGFNSLGWRDTRNRRRLLVGATMMTSEDARTELVARAMGYSSPTGFCHALSVAGLPSPGAIAPFVDRLR
jgi:AraC-like DNA-binding protein